jgi:hypothetical protein
MPSIGQTWVFASILYIETYIGLYEVLGRPHHEEIRAPLIRAPLRHRVQSPELIVNTL